MEEKILMADADLGRRDAIERISQAGEKFVKIDHHVGPATGNVFLDEMHATQIDRQPGHVVSHTAGDIVALLEAVGRKLGLSKRWMAHGCCG